MHVLGVVWWDSCTYSVLLIALPSGVVDSHELVKILQGQGKRRGAGVPPSSSSCLTAEASSSFSPPLLPPFFSEPPHVSMEDHVPSILDPLQFHALRGSYSFLISPYCIAPWYIGTYVHYIRSYICNLLAANIPLSCHCLVLMLRNTLYSTLSFLLCPVVLSLLSSLLLLSLPRLRPESCSVSQSVSLGRHSCAITRIRDIQ